MSRLLLLVLLAAATSSCASKRAPGRIEPAIADPPVTTPAPPPAAEGACGSPQEPDCPLQGWMKANPGTALIRGDMERLERAFVRIGAFGPPEYGDWAAMTNVGARAARDHDLEGARRACQGCHRAYRAEYRRDHRAAALP